MMRKTSYLLLFFPILLVCYAMVSHADTNPCSGHPAYCGTPYAWSGMTDGSRTIGAGWIKLSSSDYSVKVVGSGYLDGYAWANPRDEAGGTNNLGWLSFKSNNVTGCPGGGNCRPQAPENGGRVTGWAKFISADGNGWDGWVKFNCSSCDVQYEPHDTIGGQTVPTLTGWAWGGPSVVGWIHFDHTILGEGEELSLECSGSASQQYPRSVTWSVSISDAYPQYTYVWTGNPVINGRVGPTNNTTATFPQLYSVDPPYTATVTVTDGRDLTSTCTATVNGSVVPPILNTALAENTCNGGINLSWTPGAGQTPNGYYVYRSTDNINFSKISGLITGTSYHDGVGNSFGFSQSQTYYYYITSYVGGESGPSNIKSATSPPTCQLVSIKCRDPRVAEGTIDYLDFRVSNPSACTITGPGDRLFPQTFTTITPDFIGSTTTSPIIQTIRYTLTCGTVSTSTTCRIDPNIKPF